MSKEIDFIIKLGGSAITVKDTLETVRQVEIEDVSITLQRMWLNKKRFIVVHGAGSFGHHHAKAGGVNIGYNHDGLGDPEGVKMAFCRTRLSVCKLNHMITSALVNQGLPAVAQSLCGVWYTCDGLVSQHSIEAISSLVEDGFIPVLHGDCVLDSLRGCGILSGDTIIQMLSKTLPVKTVIFLMDVDGVYTAPPGQPGSSLLNAINVSDDKQALQGITTSIADCDVTGGIGRKLESARDMVRASDMPGFVVLLCGREVLEDACLYGRLPGGSGTTVYKKL